MAAQRFHGSADWQLLHAGGGEAGAARCIVYAAREHDALEPNNVGAQAAKSHQAESNKRLFPQSAN